MNTEPTPTAGPGSRRRTVRRRLPVQRRRDELIAAALELYSRSPGREVPIEDVADAAGASRALVYHYFGGKHGLYVAALRSAAAQLTQWLVVSPGESPRRQIDLAVGRYLDFVEQHAAGFAALLGGGEPHRDDEVGRIVNEVRQAIYDRLLEGLGIRQPTGALRLTLRGWIAAAEAASLAWLESREVERAALQQLLTGQLAGMLTAAAGQDPALASQLRPVLGPDRQLAPGEPSGGLRSPRPDRASGGGRTG
jgi:AcrR family transcriptional regulator